MRRVVYHLLAATLAFVVSCPAFPANARHQISPFVSVSQALESRDILGAKLSLDRIIDPTINSVSVQEQVDHLISAARTIAGSHPSEGAKFDAVRKVLYQAGPWNDNRPFTYDQDDPLGQNIHHKLLSDYLRSRRGNCVSMPILFMIVGRGIGLHLTLSTAPLHMFVRYTHAGLPPMNIEATSGGGFARDVWYRQNLPMSDRAIARGLYLRTHTDRETIAEMATVVLEYLIDMGRYEEAIKVADAILAANPKDGFTMVKKGTAIAHILKAEFMDKYPLPVTIPTDLRERYLDLAAANKKAFDDAEALGWEPTP